MNIPSHSHIKKIAIFSAVLILAGIIYLAISSSKDKEVISENTSEFINIDLIQDETADFVDSDGDGAYDHIERLWGLNPNNPDSDGDGVLDGRYIRIQQNNQERDRRTAIDPDTYLSESEKLVRGAGAAVLAIRGAGGSFEGETETQVASNIAEYINDLFVGEKIYTRDMLTTVADTRENVYAYRDEMTQIFTQYPVSATDIELLLKASENPENHSFELSSALDKYSAYLEKITTMPVPRSIAGRHTELINSIGQIHGSISNLNSQEYDDLVALAALIQVEQILNQTTDAILNINRYFEIIQDSSLFE